MTRTIFVSDVHLAPDSPRDHRPFLDFLESVRSGIDALYLLGDIFDYWIGPRHVKERDYRDVLRALKDFTKGGARAFFIPGNRDYFVDDAFESATGVRLLGELATFDLGGRRVAVAHGDFLYNRNPKYTAYRRMMRFPPLRSAYLAMPERMSRGIARGFQRVSKKTTAPVRWTRAEIEHGARPLFHRGIDVLVCGHIHTPQHVTCEYRGRARDVFILGDWDGGTREYLEFDGEFRLKAWA